MATIWLTGSTLWHDMFQLSLSPAEKMLRPIIVYCFLVIALRIFGKRELAQLNPFDLVVLLSLSNTVQNAIIGEDNSVLGGLIGAFTLLAVNYLLVRFLFKHKRLDQILEGSPTVLVEDGHVRPEALLTTSELLTVAHRQGFTSLDDIQRCVLEPGGTFFMQPKQLPVEARRHAEIIDHLEHMRRQIEAIAQKLQDSGLEGTP
jgi:uncharacterized membrane protein YcaP (DUF421 family)